MIKYILGGLIASVLILGSYVIYKEATSLNDTETAQKMYDLRHMSNDELNKRAKNGDRLAHEERTRRFEETKNALWIQNRD